MGQRRFIGIALALLGLLGGCSSTRGADLVSAQRYLQEAKGASSELFAGPATGCESACSSSMRICDATSAACNIKDRYPEDLDFLSLCRESTSLCGRAKAKCSGCRQMEAVDREMPED